MERVNFTKFEILDNLDEAIQIELSLKEDGKIVNETLGELYHIRGIIYLALQNVAEANKNLSLAIEVFEQN